MAEIILILDFGTSKVRAHCISKDGEIIKNVTKPYRWQETYDRIEVDPEIIWDCAQSAVKEIVADDSLEILGLSFAFFGDNVVALDAREQPVTNLMACADTRSGREVAYLKEKFGDEQHQKITGSPIMTMSVGSKILWLRNNQPETYCRAKKYFSNQQYILMRLKLPHPYDYTMASRQTLFDIHVKKWSTELLALVGLTEANLGPVVPSTQLLGTITSFGQVKLRHALPVVIGAHDSCLGILGLGAVADRELIVGSLLGTFHLIGYISDTVTGFGDMLSYISPLSDMYVNFGLSQGGGLMLDWFVNRMFSDVEQQTYARLFSTLLRLDHDLPLYIPAKSMNEGSFLRMNMVNDRFDFFRSIVHSASFELKAALAIIEAHTGTKMDLIRFGGGGAKAPEWLQLLATVCRKRVAGMNTAESSAIGAAIIGFMGLGVFTNAREAISNMCKIRTIYDPEESDVQWYEDSYAQYRKIKASI